MYNTEITFGAFHSYRDLNLILTSGVKIGTPDVKTEEVEVLGSDGTIDYTEYFGEIFYKNRSLTFPFTIKAKTPEDIDQVYKDVCKKIHGKKVEIVLDWDTDYYFKGRITVGELTHQKRIGTFTITCDCEPYRYKNDVTVSACAVSGTTTVTYINDQKNVTPQFKISSPMTISFENVTTTIKTDGTFTVPGIVFKEGENVVTYAGNGTVEVSYQERRL
ncbi:phage tail domain-containing protein [Coprococcus sp. B2-R-112]|uniref:phage tail domain-containing protein n=1 Tax=Coprococcus sp. B2-R-112 TaxID=2949662 RepID=UPI00202EC79D|nr:phage tail domain-containing protein [Coprococcus sp. B2-R-112]MCM0662329.1 phage tail family protein [Coprococcus sp. B2-R-112]